MVCILDILFVGIIGDFCVINNLTVKTLKLYTILTLAFCLLGINANGKEYGVTSPDGKISVTVLADDNLSYIVKYDGDVIVDESEISMTLADGTVVGASPRITSAKKRNIVETITAPLYRQKEFVSEANELTLKMKGGFSVIFRAYDEGVAYRFATAQKGETVVMSETAEVNFGKDNLAWLPYSTNEKNQMAMAFQNFYDNCRLSEAKDILAFLPVTVDCGDVKVTVMESDLESYPGMFISVDKEKKGLDGVFAPYPKKTDFYPWRVQEYVTETEDFIAKTTGPRNYPWRVLAVTSCDTQLPVNNLVYALASPSRIEDTSWIKGGQVAWDWWNDWGLSGVDFVAGINMDTYRYYIDFASANGIGNVVLDEGWYNPKSGDMLTVIPELDLAELIAYGKERNVNIILWTVFNVLDSQLEEACAKYKEMGVVGFKVDFLDRDDQTAVEMAYRIADACARHQLTLDYHGFYKPTGLNRTYPNVINFEGVFGMEEVKWAVPGTDMPLYDVTFPFIRMASGPVDYTPGAMTNASKADFQAIYYNPMSMGTRCHQLAAYIVHDSPLTMLCDAPTNYKGEEECVEFITSVPTVIDRTVIPAGKIGEYIVSAREKDGKWYVGGMTSWEARDIELCFDFLPEGKTYEAVFFVDGVNADKQGEDYRVEKKTVKKGDTVKIHMASGGGFAARLD